MFARLSRSFFAKDAVTVARALVGCALVHETAEGLVVGRIVETEAYDQSEPAAHSYRGVTDRTRVMFGPAGHAYVYFSYGVHWCVNVVAHREGHGAAVLLRAAEPLVGLELMAARRGLSSTKGYERRLARGPGCLTQAFGIGKLHNGADLLAGSLSVQRFVGRQVSREVVASGRIGISRARDLPWRFFERDNPFVSGRKLP